MERATFKMTDVVMLATNQKATKGSIALGKHGELLILKENEAISFNDDAAAYWKLQHLYFLSDEEIKEGNFYYNGKYIEKATKELMPLNNGVNKKIIATTDKSLELITLNVDGLGNDLHEPLPQPSQSFLEVFVKEYNKGNQIKKVMVEYEDDGHMSYPDVQVLKIKKDNTITIRQVKDSWSTKEMIEFAKYYNGTVMSIAYQDKDSDLYHNTTEQLLDRWAETKF